MDANTSSKLSRRALVALAGSALTVNAQGTHIPIIDTHIHLYDPTRPQGVPYPNPSNPAVFILTLPDRYGKAAVPLGIVGAIEVEASPWVEDNLWVLEVCDKNSIMVGTIGNLEPAKPEFGEYLERYHKNRLFRGIRCGNLWGRNLAADVARPEFLSGLKLLSEADLTLDTTTLRHDIITSTLKITDRLPNLRIVIDHVAAGMFPTDPPARQAMETDLRELAKRPFVYGKLTNALQRVDGKIPMDLEYYRSRLDLIWDVFGEDRLVFGSDWPNSTGNWVSLDESLKLLKTFIATKGVAATEKYFWRNSIAAYKWIKRDSSQPSLD